MQTNSYWVTYIAMYEQDGAKVKDFDSAHISYQGPALEDEIAVVKSLQAQLAHGYATERGMDPEKVAVKLFGWQRLNTSKIQIVANPSLR